VTEPLLHLATPAQWRAHLRAGAVLPSIAEFVHLSTPEQVRLPATRIYAGRQDMFVLALDPARIGVEVRWEPGLPTDPPSMRFPHAYGPVPTAAVLAVLPYRPEPDGTFAPPALPRLDAAGRLAAIEPSLLRRAATAEIPVTGGVAVLTEPVPASYQHNQLLIDGEADAAAVIAEADRILGAAGLAYRQARLGGARHAATAAGLAERGWHVQHIIGMAAAPGGEPDPGVERVNLDALRPVWDAAWGRDPLAGDDEPGRLIDHNGLDDAVVDLRCLAVRVAGTPVASALLKIDGATALLDMVVTEPRHRRRGHGDALVATARAMAAEAGCDLVGLEAAADHWPRGWYARRGFAEVGESWSARRTW
jgi:uncharacterized protein (DUF952 family)/GNAT superfamily N-acetyltransferase